VKPRLRLKPGILGFGLALVLLIGASWLSYRTTGRLLEAAQSRQHTEDVISEVQQVLALVVDLESGSRGFVITGTDRFLLPYQAAVEGIPTRIADLRMLTADNPRQQRQIEALDPLLKEKMAWTDGTISRRREKGLEAAAAWIGSERGRELMVQIREILTSMEEEERQLSIGRDLALAASTSRMNLALLTSAALSLVLLSAVFIAHEREVRERRRAEEQATRSETRLQAILDHSPAIIYVQDLDGRVLLVSRRFEYFYPMKVEEMIGKTVYDLLPKEAADAIRANDLRVLQTGTPLTVEEKVPQNDGVHTRLLTRFPLRDATGAIYALGGISTDVTERKRAENEVRETQVFLDSVVENIPNMIFVKRAGDLRFVRLNRAGEELLGHSREALIGKNDHDFFPKEQADAFTSRDREVLESRTLLDIPEEPIETKDGRRRFLHTKKVPLFDGSGRPAFLLGISEDITERKMALEEIERLNVALRQHSAQLESAIKELESFSYSVSHDLRAPLRHISGFTDLLRRHAEASLDEKSRGYLDTIAKSSKRMGELIDDLLVFSRMGRAEMGLARVPLGPIVAEILGEIQQDVKGRKIDWRIDPLPEVQGDHAMLRQVLVNLISNAVKYTGARPEARIEIGTQSSNGDTVVFVRDNGVGFDPRYAHKLFGVFQRLHRADQFEGTGIGLANVRRIIHRHGGKTWAEGAPDQGATFYFSLPRHQEATG